MVTLIATNVICMGGEIQMIISICNLSQLQGMNQPWNQWEWWVSVWNSVPGGGSIICDACMCIQCLYDKVHGMMRRVGMLGWTLLSILSFISTVIW